MKKSDIKVGTDYAERRGTWGSMTHVRVVSLDGKVKQGWGYNQRTISGTVVQNVLAGGELGPERTVPNRQIQEEWAPYAERVNAEARARRSADAAAKRGREARAHDLLNLIPILRNAGLPDIEIQVWDRQSKFLSALDSAGLIGDIVTKREESERGEIWGDQYTLKAPLARSIEDFVVTNAQFKISAPDLAMILGVAL